MSQTLGGNKLQAAPSVKEIGKRQIRLPHRPPGPAPGNLAGEVMRRRQREE